MKRAFAVLFVTWLALASAAWAAEEKSPVTLPKSVVVPAGGTGYLTVKIDRKLLPGKVSIALEGLPAGVRVADMQPPTLEKENDSEALITLQASTDAVAGQSMRVTVNVAGPDKRTSQTIEMQVVYFGMRPLSWLVMSVSVLSVLALTGYCVWRVLTLPPVEEETLKGPLEIDTRDTADAD